MPPPLLLFLDLGDLITKAIAVAPGGTRRLRFPSVVAHRLLGEGAVATDLLLADGAPVQRPSDFIPETYPRTRSYAGADAVLREADPVEGARFAGWLAAKYGAERRLLASHPTSDTIDALVRKALLRAAGGSTAEAELVFVVDMGEKAEALRRYASAPPREVHIEAWRLGSERPREIDLTVRSVAMDAPECAVAALPPELSPPAVERVLLVDIGYLRTRLAVVSPQGCEHQQEVPELGMSDCVRRVLRDGQDQGLVEDELAVGRALERGGPTIEVAGRSFDVSGALREAADALADEVARVARRALLSCYERSGELCGALAVMGGGAAVAGDAVVSRIRRDDLGVSGCWVARDPSFTLLSGARRLHARGRSAG